MNKLDKHINKTLKLNKKYYKNSNEFYNAHLIAYDYLNGSNTIFVVLPNLYEAQKYYDLIGELVEEENLLFYPTDQTLTMLMSLGSSEFQSERLYTIDRLLTNKKFIVVTTIEATTMHQLSVEDYKNGKLTLKTGNNYKIEDITNFLVTSGYHNDYTVEIPGSFSVRGGIIDIYTRNKPHPYRLDFFGEHLESIKLFDIDSQRSFEETNNVEINPMNELFYTSKMANEAIERINKHFEKYKLSIKEETKLTQDIQNIKQRNNLSTLNIYIPFFNNQPTSIFDFSNKKKIYFIDYYKMETNEKQKIDDLNNYAQTMDGSAFLSINYKIPIIDQEKQADILINNIGFNDLISTSIGVYDVNTYHGNLDLFYYEYKQSYKNYFVYLSLSGKSYLKEVTNYFEKKSINLNETNQTTPNLYFNKDKIVGSFHIPKDNLLYVTDSSLYNAKMKKAIRYRSVINQSTKIRHVDELQVGDFVVHYDFGIGRYVGLETMDLTGTKRDYLHILYKDDEALYVPMEQIDLVLKYGNYDGAKPNLSKMGGRAWRNTKNAVKKKIKDYSDRLLKIYALREKAVGFAFNKDDELQLSFENDFQYELTKDQQITISEVKEDMHKPKPMDRIIIGDVGFGKTEIALRAAFKAVLSGKQVLYLVPTTVLARQHYYTFRDRFEKYGGTVELLNRFVTKKRQKEILTKLNDGFVDVVIGTHRLLSKDVVFNDLGLLIVDEEQRFGVMHKERIKEIKINVDTLTLSATPIPRTLQMSIMGIKDLSTIETPPLNRYPVQTYVVPRQDALIKEAIRREIARGGQIFYLYNKVATMDIMVTKLHKLIPEAKIAYAHGKMNKSQLENTISNFIDHQYDILVATTIIETGIDIPNTNTLIIHEADKLGLSQLYQIRGRVGRSDKIAYAYLMFDNSRSLKDESQKRLKALEEFTALGSGYKIAMRDLSIRGAGDILGSEQSGFIDSVGLELYTKLLEEVLYGKKPNKVKEELKEVYAKRHIDPNYISRDSIRIEIHKKVSSLNSMSDVVDLQDELEDRFGPIDLDILLYMYEKLFKKLSYKIGVKKVVNTKNMTRLTINKEKSKNIDGKKLFEYANRFIYPVKLGYLKEQVEITFNYTNATEHWLYVTAIFLDNYVNKLTFDNEKYFKKS